MSVPDIAAPGRVKSRGSLLRALERLRKRTLKYGEHRASTHEEVVWSGQLLDRLNAAYVEAMQSEAAQASLRAFERHRNVARKVPATPELLP